MNALYRTYHSSGGMIIVILLAVFAYFAFIKGPENSRDITLQYDSNQSEIEAEIAPPTTPAPMDDITFEAQDDGIVFNVSDLPCNPTSSAIDSEENRMLSKINSHRASIGAPALSFSGVLNDAADIMVWDQNKNGYNAHTDSAGNGPQPRLRACGYTTGLYGENAGHAGTTDQMFTMWLNSQGHRDAIEHDGYGYIGIARAPRPSGGGHFWITDFTSVNPGGSISYDNSPTATPLPTNAPATCDTAAQQQGHATFQAYCAANGQCTGGSSNNSGTLSCSCVPCSPTATPVQQALPTATPIASAPQATATPLPNVIPSGGNIQFSVSLAGIGPNEGAGQNSLPNSAKNGVAEFINIETNQSIERANLTFVYDIQSGTFKGGAQFTEPGAYEVRLRLNNTLWRNIGLVEIAGSENHSLPSREMVLGDMNQDNTLDLSDYNTLVSCFTMSACPAQSKSQADLNMDGKVDERDLNIFYNSLASRQGD